MSRSQAFLLVLLAAQTPAAAGATEIRSVYGVSFLGIGVARTELALSIRDDAVRVSGSFRTSGLAALVDPTRGTLAATGRLRGEGFAPQTYDLRYALDGKARSTVIRFQPGRPASAVNLPPPKPRGRDWVTPSAADLTGALDPVLASLVRAPGPAGVCGRTVKVFDGELVAAIALEPAGAGRWKDMDTVICRARFKPIAGYRKGNRNIEYFSTRAKMTAEFAPVSGSDLWAPVRMSLGTRFGTARITAQSVEIAGD